MEIQNPPNTHDNLEEYKYFEAHVIGLQPHRVSPYALLLGLVKSAPAGSSASAGTGNPCIKIGSRRENLIDLNNGRNWESYQYHPPNKKKSPIMTFSKQDISPYIANVGERKHYLCGCYACCEAFNNVAITFPIQKVLFQQKLYGIKTRASAEEG